MDPSWFVEILEASILIQLVTVLMLSLFLSWFLSPSIEKVSEKELDCWGMWPFLGKGFDGLLSCYYIVVSLLSFL